MEVFSKVLIGLGVTGSCGSITAPLLINSTANDIAESQKITFKELGEQINENGKREQKLKDQILNELPLKEELEKGFLTEVSTDQDKTGEVIKNEGRDCQNAKANMKNYCGYLETYRDNISYKLKIDYELDNNLGKGYFVKNDGGHKKYGDSQSSQWKEISNVNFNKLESFDETNEDEGSKITELSFKKEIKGVDNK